MNETIFRFYGLFHRLAKYISGYRYSATGNIYFNNDLSLGIKAAETFSWQDFISNSEIPAHDPNSGLHYAGYVAETHSWCHAAGFGQMLQLYVHIVPLAKLQKPRHWVNCLQKGRHVKAAGLSVTTMTKMARFQLWHLMIRHI